METIKDIVANEFALNGYKRILEIEGRPLMKASSGTDYWVIGSDVKDYYKQKELFDNIPKQQENFEFIEKNLSLLLLINVNNQENKDVDVIQIENDKSYFKKYVIKYDQESVKGLIEIMEKQAAESIASLLLDMQYFVQLKEETEHQTAVSLLYNISHKLPFIPLMAAQKQRVETHLEFESSELTDLLTWVNDAPTDENRIEKYINDSILDNNEYQN